MRIKDCHDCGAAPGSPHDDGCDVARCMECGGQRISCKHYDSEIGWGQVWTGKWPGVAECEEFGWWVQDRCGEGLGFVQCAADAPGATADLNRLSSMAFSGQITWDRDAGRWRL